MTRVTRRGLVGGLGLGAASLAACNVVPQPKPKANAPIVAFNHGVASGDPTMSGVVIWTRVTPLTSVRVDVKWVVARDAALKTPIRQGVAQTGPERDYTVKVDVSGLEAEQTYHYGFIVGSVASPVGRTRTLPGAGAQQFRMAVVSCSNFQFGFFNAYREIAKRADIDAVVHLGDYFYEHGPEGYGGQVGRELGRLHEPPHEAVTLGDYRTRFAQYRQDPDLQAAHASTPWFCSWDDHESANDANVSGAENHQPETEGAWSARKSAAVQAYLEWMPMRDPEPGLAREAIYRAFDIGDLGSLFVIETRLLARSPQMSLQDVFKTTPKQQAAALKAFMREASAPDRTLMGGAQEAWLAQGLKASRQAGRPWQVIANQVLMAKVRTPDLERALKPQRYAALSPEVKARYAGGRIGAPWSTDSWSGYPAARERLLGAAVAADAHLVVLSGDTHSAWAAELHDVEGRRAGVEFACTAITSESSDEALHLSDMDWVTTEANPEVVYYKGSDKGFTLVTLKPDQVEAEYIKLNTVRSRDYSVSVDARFIARAAPVGMEALQRSLSSVRIKAG